LRLRILSVGVYAARFIKAHRTARIAAIFERSLHLTAGEDVLCLGGKSLGNGPINAILDVSTCVDWIGRAGKVANQSAIDNTCLNIGDLDLDASEAATWQPPPWPADLSRTSMLAGLDAVLDVARRYAPSDGLARLSLGLSPPEHAATAVERVAAPHLHALIEWLDARLAAQSSDTIGTAAPTGLLGLGPGLTPSGDDVLCGVLVALRAVARQDAAAELAQAIARDAPERTTLLSRAFLRAAAEGHASELLHETVAALVENARQDLPRLILRLGGIGHTSGWDALAGAVLAIRAAARSDRGLRSP